VHLQPTKLSDAQALPTSWLVESTRGLQPGETSLVSQDHEREMTAKPVK